MHFIKKKSLSRRTFLKASGISIGIPLLDAMIPAFANAQAAQPPLRVAYFYFPHGIKPGFSSWKASSAGSNFSFPAGLSSTNIVNHKNDIVLLGGLLNHWGQYGIYGDYGNDHACASGTYLTGARLNWRSSVASLTLSTQDASRGPFALATGHRSVDVMIAEKIAGSTKLPILNITPPGFANFDPGTADYDADYRTYLSWSGPSTPTARLTSPADIFTNLFGGQTTTPTNPTPTQGPSLASRKKSILDAVLDQATSLNATLGTLDKIKMDEYLTAVREVERTIQSDTPEDSTPVGSTPQACQSPSSPGSGFGYSPTGFAQMTKANLDLIALAFQCDQTRVVSYLMDWELSNLLYRFAGANTWDAHQASHGGSPFGTSYNDARSITNWYADQFAYLISKLKATQDAYGPILNSSILHMGSGTNTDSGDHPDDNLPMIIAGQGNGLLSTGRAVNLPTTRLENYHLTLLQKIGVNVSSFGGSTGAVNGIFG